MVHTSPVQGVIAKKASVLLGDFAECEVRIRKLDLNLFKREVTARGVEVFDSRNNRTVFVPEVLATLKSYNFKSPSLSSLTLYDPHVAIRRYQGDTMSDFKRVLKKIAALPKKDTALRKAFIIEKARVYNGKFSYDAEDAAPVVRGKIDFKHVGLENLNLHAENFYSRCGVVRVKVNHVRGKEKTGFQLNGLSTDVYVRRGELYFSGARFQTPASKASLSLSLVAQDWKLYRNFIRNVRMEGEIYSSEILLQDLAYFAPVFQSMPQHVSLAGKVEGPVADMDLQGLRLSYGKATRLEADAHLKGLPKIKETFIDLYLKKLQTEKSDWANFTLPHHRSLVLPKIFDELNSVDVSGVVSGDSQQRLTAEMAITTNIGTVRINGIYKDTIDSGCGFWAGKAVLSDIRLDKLLHNDTLFGKADIETDFCLSGQDFKEMSYAFSGEAGHLELAGKNVAPLDFDLEFGRKYMQAYVSCTHPELDFTFDGTLDRTQDLAKIHGELNLNHINLQPLHLLGDTGLFTLNTHIEADYAGYGKGIESGHIVMKDLRVQRLGNRYALSRLNVEVDREDTLRRTLSVRSSLLDADVAGRWNLRTLKTSLWQTLSVSLPNIRKMFAGSGEDSRPVSAQDFDLHIRLKDTGPLLAVLYPAVSLPLGLDVDMEYVSERGRGWAEVKVPYVQVGKFAYLAGEVDVNVGQEKFEMNTTAERLYIDDSIAMNDFAVYLQKTDSNTLDYTLEWGRDSLARQKTNAMLGGRIDFLSSGAIRIGMQDYNLLLDKNVWRSYPDGYLLVAKDSLVMNHVGVFSTGNREKISLNGELSRREGSVLKVDFSDFDLAYLEFFLRKTRMKIEARLNGALEVRDFFGDFLFNAGLGLDNLSVNGYLYGKGLLKAAFSKKEAVKASFTVQDSSQKRTLLSLKGGFYPREQKRLDFEGYANDFSVAFLSRILASVADGLEGSISGRLGVSGTLSQPELHASVTARNFAATIPLLQTRYRFSDFGLELTSDKIEFPSAVFVDPVFETNGKMSGRILHRNFKDMRLDLGLSFDELLVLQSKRSPRLPFWGTIFATGNLDITGPVNDISMRLNATVEDNSDIFFDFSNPSGGTGVNYITFQVPSEQKKDSASVSLEQYYFHNRAAMHRKGKLTMDLNMNITPGLAVSVLLRNTAMNGDLKATGKGLLRLHMAEGIPQLFGTYTISDGEFDFSMVNVINKRFDLKEGGTISWVGPMTDARINVQAGYQTKASLYPVLAAFDPGNESRYKQKVNVESRILLSGRLLNPDIGFDIDLSNTDEDTKDKFRAIVKKDDEDEMLRQTFSILMFNSFMAVEGSSTNVANTALSSSSEILFSQFNNFLSKLTNDFNIGINYKPGTTVSNSEFQVMMSGQLFNDRLVINGNLGVSENTPGNTGATNATTVVGDVDIEWKFTEELRLRGFNHSNDEDLTKPVNSYTQGVGIVFRRDFDNVKEFLYGTRPRRTKEERRADRKKNREIRRAKHSQE